jgi:two-component system sensor histidine kinase PilS (NtrC family)
MLVTSRIVLAMLLVGLQSTLLITGTSHDKGLLMVSLAYLAATLFTRWQAKPRPLGSNFSPHWFTLVGLDVLAFSALQWMQGGNVNYTPLFALPVLMASVLGSMRLALGTAAGITMLMLGATAVTYLATPYDATNQFVQSALSGVGYFAVAFLANQLSVRLANEGRRAQFSQAAARAQQQVNELIIEALPDGVLIVNHKGFVRSANPAAHRLLGGRFDLQSRAFDLREDPGWRPLLELAQMSVQSGQSLEEDVALQLKDYGPSRIHVRTKLAVPHGPQGESICVLFLQDQRELEARMRTEKLASMGRMSTAVAHEIRNPLAAITQANALLDEDITDPKHKQLTAMVNQNAKRLDKIVHDILNVARVHPGDGGVGAVSCDVWALTERVCHDWSTQNGKAPPLRINTTGTLPSMRFDSEHLRRVLINLLDNASRYASAHPQSIQVYLEDAEPDKVALGVWSDGAPMDPSVERHLFEPFFSSESRSSGLGLYICRELCASHQAVISYLRSTRLVETSPKEGNAFVIGFAP